MDRDDEKDEDEDKSPPAVSHTEACCALEIVLAYVEQQPGVHMSTTVMLNSILVEAAMKRSMNQN